MAAQLQPLPDYSRLNWLQERRKGIGGSDVAPLLGLSKYADNDEWSVFLAKTGQHVERPKGLNVDLGHLLEPVVTTLYERRTQRQCWNPGADPKTKIVQHPEHACLIGSPDRLIIGERRGLEIKAIGWKGDDFGIEGTDQVPTDYLLQCVHYMAVCDIDVWDLAVLFLGSREFAIYTIRRDRALEADIIAKLIAWWELRIVKGVEPDIGPSVAYRDSLHDRYPRHRDGLELTPSRDLALAALEHVRAAEAIRGWEAVKLTAENRIKTMLGMAERSKGPNWSVSWKAQKPRTYTDWETIAQGLMESLSVDERAALIAANTREGAPIRPLRITLRA